MIATLFNYGAFGAEDVRMAGYSLMAYSFGLMAFTMVKILAPGYFSRQDTRTPVKISVIALLTNIVLNLLIVLPMLWLELPAPHAGLALATGLAAALNAFLLYRGLRRLDVYRPGSGWGWMASRVLLANMLMGALLWWLAGGIDGWLEMIWYQRAARLALCIAAGFVTYGAVLWLSGIRLRHLSSRLA
jgi:putative peptidoglycan lipid II flippase